MTPVPGAIGRPRILLLEDSAIDAELICIHLDRAGIESELMRARSKAEFEAALAAGTPFDLMLADYSLPDFDGMAALRRVRELLPDVPVIFVSGVGGEDLATSALRNGATDYVLKRNLARLPTAITRALAEHRERVQRREAEASLVASEANMRLALEAATLGLWQYTDDDSLTCDERCRAMAGIRAEHVTYASFLEQVHPADRNGLDRAVQTALRGDDAGSLAHECRFLTADREVRWIVMRGSRLTDAERGLRMTGVMQDVTSTRTLETRQRHAEVLFRLAAQATGLGIWEIGPDREQVWFDDGIRAIAGMPADAVGGLSPLIAQLVHPDDRGVLAEAIDRALAADGDDDIELEHRLIRADDGALRWVAVKGRRFVGVDGQDRLIGTVRDITEQRRMRSALEESNEELERRVAERTRELTAEVAERGRVEDTLRQMQRLEAVGQLTSGVAHDFNNLLTVVLSNIGLIRKLLAQQEPADERVAKRLSSMHAAATRGAVLTRQLLAFSRRQRLEPQTVSFNDIVHGMRDLLQSTLGGSVHLETDLAPDAWPALVDPTQMELIILNLAINARDAMEVGGSLCVATANMTRTEPATRPGEPEPGEYVVLSVSDTGSGMTPDVLAKAFEPFFTTKEVGKGSGLGLAQVFGFAKQSGGGVAIDTELGVGTTVRVFMPRSRVAPLDAHAAAGAADALPPELRARAAAGRTLLLVDDDREVREATAALLADHGFRVDEAGDGAAALQRLRDAPAVDLVIADFAMPRMNGAELARAIRAQWPAQPILFMTGYADLGALKDVPESDLLLKPVEEAQLLSRVLGKLPAAPRRSKARQTG